MSKVERLGLVGINNFGSKMVIVEYNKAVDIWVEFEDNGNRVHTSYNAFCKGDVKNNYDRTVCNVGFIGEGKYKSNINGKRTLQYKYWQSMVIRCYDKKFQEKHPTYLDCKVVPEWHNFQNFARWYDENYYEVEGETVELDKDIIIKGNKIYSPEFCVFVPKRINSLFTKCDKSRGQLPLGVYYRKDSGKYAASCSDGNGKTMYLGQYNDPIEAFTSYKSFKEKLIKSLAGEYMDEIPSKLYDALNMYEVEFDD